MQTRLSSSRLPAKGLLDICGLPAVIMAAKRAGNKGNKVTVATSIDSSDDILCNVLERYNIDYIRGPLDDVMSRFLLAAKDMRDHDAVVRLTGDNLFVDNDFIQKYLNDFFQRGAEYMGSSGSDIDLPYGMSVEVFYAGALRKSAQINTDPYSREHVTPPFFQGKERVVPDRNKLTTLPKGLEHIRCTMDTFEDYIRICRIFNSESDPVNVNWEVLCKKLIELENNQ